MRKFLSQKIMKHYYCKTFLILFELINHFLVINAEKLMRQHRNNLWNIQTSKAGKFLPGRTFLGKRRYFSDIVALTPLTPLTYKQNAVNAFILTSKTPLTPLYRQRKPLTPLAFRLNAVNAVIPEETCVFKKSDFLTP